MPLSDHLRLVSVVLKGHRDVVVGAVRTGKLGGGDRRPDRIPALPCGLALGGDRPGGQAAGETREPGCPALWARCVGLHHLHPTVSEALDVRESRRREGIHLVGIVGSVGRRVPLVHEREIVGLHNDDVGPFSGDGTGGVLRHEQGRRQQEPPGKKRGGYLHGRWRLIRRRTN